MLGRVSLQLSSVAPNVITCNAAIASFEEARRGRGIFSGGISTEGNPWVRNVEKHICYNKLIHFCRLIYIYIYIFIFIDINYLYIYTYICIFVFKRTVLFCIHICFCICIYTLYCTCIYANVLKMYSCVRGALQMCFPEWHRLWASLQQPQSCLKGVQICTLGSL